MTTELANKKACIFNNVKLFSNVKLLYIHTVECYLVVHKNEAWTCTQQHWASPTHTMLNDTSTPKCKIQLYYCSWFQSESRVTGITAVMASGTGVN